MPHNAYIHIPFCKSKCAYCSFVSYPHYNAQYRHEYVKTLLREIKHFYKNEPLNTLYLGGGTPSLLEVNDLGQILNSFKFSDNPEITIEVNPETVDFEKLKAIRSAGFNRLSVGVQSFDDGILKTIGRVHDSEKAVQTIRSAFEAGFDNVSADFIYGLPQQPLEGFCDDLKKAVGLGVTHISLYGLKIEKGCAFYEKQPENLADDDLQADMYLAAIDILEKNGFVHYEISNFAKLPQKSLLHRFNNSSGAVGCMENSPAADTGDCEKGIGFESRHNLNYWNASSYYGFGAGAHGYDSASKTRYENFCDLEKYAANYTQKAASTVLTPEQMLEEAIFLGFRRAAGLNVRCINENFGIDFDKKYVKILEKYLQSGHILKTGAGYRLSNEGFLLSNLILADFI